MMRKRKVTVTLGLPELEPDEASPSKSRSFGARVGAAVSRIEAAEAAAVRQVHRVVEAAPAAPGREPPEGRRCAFCGQPGNRAKRGTRKFIDWQLVRHGRTTRADWCGDFRPRRPLAPPLALVPPRSLTRKVARGPRRNPVERAATSPSHAPQSCSPCLVQHFEFGLINHL